jgi:formate dehydrogenase major subunit
MHKVLDAKMVTFTLNGKTVAAPADQTILETADGLGIDIPRLCYMEGMRADGNCRTCACSRRRAAATRRTAWR